MVIHNIDKSAHIHRVYCFGMHAQVVQGRALAHEHAFDRDSAYALIRPSPTVAEFVC